MRRLLAFHLLLDMPINTSISYITNHIYTHTHILYNINSFGFRLIFSIFSFAVTKFVRIGIADKNDSPPYFDRFLYETEIDENAELQSTVLTVNAKDHNECE